MINPSYKYAKFMLLFPDKNYRNINIAGLNTIIGSGY